MRTDLADGSPFGAEYFAPDRQVVWQDIRGTCLRGEWRAEKGSICYHYDGMYPSCLRYRVEDGVLIGYEWETSGGEEGFLGSTVRLTPVESPPLTCNGAPLS